MAESPLLSILDQIERLTRESLRKVDSNSRDTIDIDKEFGNIASKDQEFREALDHAREKINVYNKIGQCNKVVAQQNDVIVQLMDNLKQAESSLLVAIENAQKVLPSSDSRSVASEDLIKYAYEISSNHAVCAPTNWQPGDSRRPYPIDIEMRAGILGKLLDSEDNADDVTRDAAQEVNGGDISPSNDDSGDFVNTTIVQNENLSDHASNSEERDELLSLGDDQENANNSSIGIMSSDSSSSS